MNWRAWKLITKEQIAQLKNVLLERQSELIQNIKSNYGLEAEFAREITGELSNYDNHPADLGTELFEREKDLSLNEHAEKELEDINAALHAVEEGTYGICSVCGEDIPFDRLDAVPTAEHCIKHAPTNIFEHPRTVEEEVFSPNINPDEEIEEDEDQNIFDAEDSWQDVARYGTSETPSDLYGVHLDYNDMFANSDEEIGGTEEIELIATADIHGHYDGVAVNHNRYEEEYDDYRRDEDLESE